MYKTAEPHIPSDIRNKIDTLNLLIDQASVLYDEIMRWYQKELDSYSDPADKVDAEDELFHPGIGSTVMKIDDLEILEGLSKMVCYNEVRNDAH